MRNLLFNWRWFYRVFLAGGADGGAVVLGEEGAEQLTVLLQQLHGQGLVLLAQGAVAHQIGEHYGGELALRDFRQPTALTPAGSFAAADP